MDMPNKLVDLKNSRRQIILEKTNEMEQSCVDETKSTDTVTMQEQLITIRNHSPNKQLSDPDIKVKSPIESVSDNVEEMVSNNIASIDADNNEMTG